MDQIVWPLTDSQILALQAVEEKLAAWEQERQRRAQLVFRELATSHGEDAANYLGTLETRDGRAVFVVRLKAST